MGKFMAQNRNFDSFGVYSHISAPMDKREIWHGGADRPPCQISRLSGQRVAPVGRKTHFWASEQKQYRHGCATRRPAGKHNIRKTQHGLRSSQSHRWLWLKLRWADVHNNCRLRLIREQSDMHSINNSTTEHSPIMSVWRPYLVKGDRSAATNTLR